MINVTKAWLLTDACPTSFEGLTDDRRHVFTKYRGGHLGVYIGDKYEDACVGERVASVLYGNCQACPAITRKSVQLCCSMFQMSYDELRALTPGIRWPDELTECADEEEWLAICEAEGVRS